MVLSCSVLADARGKPLDLLQAKRRTRRLGFAAQGSLHTAGLEQFVGRDLQCGGEPDDHMAGFMRSRSRS